MDNGYTQQLIKMFIDYGVSSTDNGSLSGPHLFLSLIFSSLTATTSAVFCVSLVSKNSMSLSVNDFPVRLLTAPSATSRLYNLMEARQKQIQLKPCSSAPASKQISPIADACLLPLQFFFLFFIFPILAVTEFHLLAP